MIKKQSRQERYNQERKEQKDRRREMILSTAAGLFLENGLKNVLMKNIADKANISKVTLYRYYSNLDEIAFEVAVIMLKKITEVSSEDIPVEEYNINLFFKGFKNMIDRFEDLKDAFRYISMFDNTYTSNYPNEELASWYKQQIAHLYKHRNTDYYTLINEKQKDILIMVGNAVMSFLEKMASRGELMENEQGVSVKKQLSEFKKMVDIYLESINLL